MVCEAKSGTARDGASFVPKSVSKEALFVVREKTNVIFTVVLYQSSFSQMTTTQHKCAL